MKTCIRCYIKKENSEFYKHPQTKDGLLNKCKECCKGYARNNRSKEKDHQRYHGNAKRRLYIIWRGMNGRCYDENNPRFNRYGGRGIFVEWKSFQEFYDDMIDSFNIHKQNNTSSHKRIDTTIDRIDTNGNYSKENCKWSTCKEQACNRSK